MYRLFLFVQVIVTVYGRVARPRMAKERIFSIASKTPHYFHKLPLQNQLGRLKVSLTARDFMKSGIYASKSGLLTIVFKIHCQWTRIFKSSVNDARYQGTVRIEYSLHSLFGRQFKVLRHVRYGGIPYLEIEVDGESMTIPAWMTQRCQCSHLRYGIDPACSWNALLEVQELLDANEL